MPPDQATYLLMLAHALGLALGALVTAWGARLRLEGAEAEVAALRRRLNETAPGWWLSGPAAVSSYRPPEEQP